MASSSSAPAPEPRPYEVFLSFRGEDTRNNFVSHLHYALKHRGVITYFDETNLQNGQTISIELPKAIQESAIAIVVLSKNYGSSTWCLNELVKIVERKKQNKLTIYPIFYHVEPSDVRHQRNSFFEAFSNHEVNFKVEMVNAWREALTVVASLTGVDIQNQQNEASCMEKIVREILSKLPLEASHSKESFVEMESRMKIKRLIYSHPDEVRSIGIWGMTGVGKTTTARAMFDECKSEFEGSCFLPDVRTKKNKIEKLQQQLIYQVLNIKVGINDVFQGSRMIRNRMCNKRVLLVIDDVDDTHQLNVLAGKWSWFGKGSRIIITTRDEHLLNSVHDKYVIDHAFETEREKVLKEIYEQYLVLHHDFKNDREKDYETLMKLYDILEERNQALKKKREEESQALKKKREEESQALEKKREEESQALEKKLQEEHYEELRKAGLICQAIQAQERKRHEELKKALPILHFMSKLF